jgi:hypothetical protein
MFFDLGVWLFRKVKPEKPKKVKTQQSVADPDDTNRSNLNLLNENKNRET